MLAISIFSVSHQLSYDIDIQYKYHAKETNPEILRFQH